MHVPYIGNGERGRPVATVSIDGQTFLQREVTDAEAQKLEFSTGGQAYTNPRLWVKSSKLHDYASGETTIVNGESVVDAKGFRVPLWAGRIN